MRHELWVLLVILFAWPAGIVVGNLIASFLWLPVQWTGLHLKLAAHHGSLHARIDELKELLDPCPHCGNRRSEASLLPSMTASSIISDSKDTKA